MASRYDIHVLEEVLLIVIAFLAFGVATARQAHRTCVSLSKHHNVRATIKQTADPLNISSPGSINISLIDGQNALRAHFGILTT